MLRLNTEDVSDFHALVVFLKAFKKACAPFVMELNGCYCDSEVKDEDTTETQPLCSRADVPCSLVATADLERSSAGAGAHPERRVSNSRSGRQRLDSSKKNRPRMSSRFGANVSKLATQLKGWTLILTINRALKTALLYNGNTLRK